MKKNMRKVPIIQTKSDIYHRKEDDEAENIISGIDKLSSTDIIIEKESIGNKTEDTNLLVKITTKLKNLFGK